MEIYVAKRNYLNILLQSNCFITVSQYGSISCQYINIPYKYCSNPWHVRCDTFVNMAVIHARYPHTGPYCSSTLSGVTHLE
jgi:hypothetical protein